MNASKAAIIGLFAVALCQVSWAQRRPGGGGAGGDGVAPAQSVPIAVPWIDTHIHLRARNGDYSGAAEQAMQLLKSSGAVGAVLMAQPFPEQANPNKHDLTQLVPAVKNKGAWFAVLGGGGSLNGLIEKTPANQVTPELKASFIAQAHQILDSGAAGFGEMALLHLSHFDGHPFEEVAPDHPLMLALADVAAERDKLLDVHMDIVDSAGSPPAALQSATNPQNLRPNVAAFERLLEHNRRARIMLAHAGWDVTGQWTVALSRRLLARHSNLYMSLKLSPSPADKSMPVGPQGVRPDWAALIAEFPDRFVIGSDSFFAAPGAGGPGTVFRLPPTKLMLEGLPLELAERIGWRNAATLYKLNPPLK